jgi:hypothetical protein
MGLLITFCVKYEKADIMFQLFLQNVFKCVLSYNKISLYDYSKSIIYNCTLV